MKLTRREWIAALGAAPLLADSQHPRIAITMDDVRWQAIPQPYGDGANEAILGVLKQHRIHAALFVIGSCVDNDRGKQILQSWNDAGHIIGNHTYSHVPYGGRMLFDDFSKDMLRCEPLISGYSNFARLFRFPALKEGRTAEQRDQMRAFLDKHAYRNGCVTIDASDWYYDQRLRDRLAKDPGFDVQRYRQPYLDHMWDRAQYYDSLSRKVLGRSVPHTVLIHYNLINTLFLADLLALFKKNGWQCINAREAFDDPVFRREPNIVPAGESLIWALAKEKGGFDLRYPGEDGEYEKDKIDRIG